ncbi:MAG: YcxB family protein [Microscillaceae bacterium]|jgi:hypothetical protein|nr:YcxB family protein [Microscillaceae bacterium]
MIVKTKKYQLDPKTYRRICMQQIFKTQWWLPISIFAGLIVLNLLLNLVYPNIWIFFLAPLGLLGWYGFWWVQFTGAPYLAQMKPMFEKFSYEISGKDILMRVNQKEGMQMKWEMVKRAEKTKDAYLLIFSQAQFIYLPFKIFNSDNDMRFTEAIMKRKNLLTEDKKEEKAPVAK